MHTVFSDKFPPSILQFFVMINQREREWILKEWSAVWTFSFLLRKYCRGFSQSGNYIQYTL